MREQGGQSKTFSVWGMGGAVDPGVVEELSVEEGELTEVLLIISCVLTT